MSLRSEAVPESMISFSSGLPSAMPVVAVQAAASYALHVILLERWIGAAIAADVQRHRSSVWRGSWKRPGLRRFGLRPHFVGFVSLYSSRSRHMRLAMRKVLVQQVEAQAAVLLLSTATACIGRGTQDCTPHINALMLKVCFQ